MAYGGAEGASSLAFTVLAIYYLIFLTDVAGISRATAGAILPGLRILFEPVLACFILLSAFIACFMPMTRARHRALVEAIEARRRGELRALDDFKELL